MPLKPLLALLTLAATWGGSYLLIAVALETTTPATVTFARFLPSAVLLLFLARRHLRVIAPLWKQILLLALVQQAAPMFLIALGEQRIPSGLAGTLIAATPMWGALLAPVLGGARPSRATWVGLTVGLTGVGLLLGASGGAVLGCVMVLLAALGYAVGAAWTGRRYAGVPKLGLLAGVLTASSLLLVPPVLLDPPTRLPDAQGVLAMLVLGLVGTGLAFVLFYWLIGEVGPERTTLVTYLAPVFAVLYGAVLLDESLSLASISGLVLVLLGAYLAGRRVREVGRRRRRARAPDAPVATG